MVDITLGLPGNLKWLLKLEIYSIIEFIFKFWLCWDYNNNVHTTHSYII